MTTSADRAARLKLVDDEADEVRREEHEAASKRRYGNWRWRIFGDEIQFRNVTLPTLRIDLLRSEARDFGMAIGTALYEKPLPMVRITKAERARQKKARGAWNKAHAIERAAALKALADEFRENGGWG